MCNLTATPIVDGAYFVEAKEANLRILCGCPENIVKHLIKNGFIRQEEKSGIRFETGPNAILLSETPLEAGSFRNLAEFPVLQMLYLQGMIIPGHPNNDGSKPLIVGLRNQLDAVSAYIYEGNYGLTSAREIAGGGINLADAEEMLKTKRAFAFGRFRESAELLELKAIEGPIVEIKSGVFLRREDVNRFEFIFEGKTVRIDLGASLRTPLPYSLPRKPIPTSAFGVAHLGEGDGWDPDRQCMSSLIVAGDEKWLIDAGPNIEDSLTAVGLSVNDLTGILHSHVHDDHFAGIPALMRSTRKLTYGALPCVRRSTSKKMAALAGITESDFGRYFQLYDLDARCWNIIGNIEVLPIPAPHPVENSLFRIRRVGGNGRVYAHYADLTSFAVMESLSRSKNPDAVVSRATIESTKKDYLEPASIKKVDVGGGMIHGEIVDFIEDLTPEIFFSHCPLSVPKNEESFGRIAEFGEFSELDDSPVEKFSTIETQDLAEATPEQRELTLFFEKRSFFAGISKSVILSCATGHSRSTHHSSGEVLFGESGKLWMIIEGEGELHSVSRIVETVRPGSIFGEAQLFSENSGLFNLRASTPMSMAQMNNSFIEEYPLLLWRCQEIFERRIAIVSANLDFSWRKEFEIGFETIDAQHKEIFRVIEETCNTIKSEGVGFTDAITKMAALVDSHFDDEEQLMEKISYPALDEHRRAHKRLRQELADIAQLESAYTETGAFMKDCFLRHSLVMDFLYLPYLKKALQGTLP